MQHTPPKHNLAVTIHHFDFKKASKETQNKAFCKTVLNLGEL